MRSRLKYELKMWAEQSPDIYAGENYDQVHHRFECSSEGDRESEFLDIVTLDASAFPPGTTIEVKLPCCPDCGQDVELCLSDDTCDFDWDAWRNDVYS